MDETRQKVRWLMEGDFEDLADLKVKAEGMLAGMQSA